MDGSKHLLHFKGLIKEKGAKLLPTKNERLQAIWHTYEKTHQHLPTSARQAVDWAVSKGLLALPEIDPSDVLIPLP